MSIKFDVNQSNIYRIAEDPQTLDVRFALTARNKGERTISNMMPFVRCRDFFTDIVYTQSFKLKHFEKYDFVWRYDKQLERRRLNNNYLSMSIKAKPELLENFKKHLWVLHAIEKEMKLRPTHVMRYSNTENTEKWIYKDGELLHIRFDAKWLANSVMITFYTFLCRFISGPFDFEGASAYELLTSARANADDELIYEVYYDIFDLQFTLTTNKEALEALTKQWTCWVGTFYQPVKFHEADDAVNSMETGQIHSYSCVISLFTHINKNTKSQVIQPWVEKGKVLINQHINDTSEAA